MSHCLRLVKKLQHKSRTPKHSNKRQKQTQLQTITADDDLETSDVTSQGALGIDDAIFFMALFSPQTGGAINDKFHPPYVMLTHGVYQ